jgi:hypothetical protein
MVSQIPFSYSDVGNFIIGQLDADNLPRARSTADAYCVIMPANILSGDARVDKTVPLPPERCRVVSANFNIIWNVLDLGDVDNDPPAISESEVAEARPHRQM